MNLINHETKLTERNKGMEKKKKKELTVAIVGGEVSSARKWPRASIILCQNETWTTICIFGSITITLQKYF